MFVRIDSTGFKIKIADQYVTDATAIELENEVLPILVNMILSID